MLGVILFIISQPVLSKGESRRWSAELNGELAPTERQRAVLGLLNHSGLKIFDPLIHSLKDPDPLVRHAAAWALPWSLDFVYFKDKESVTEITHSLLPQLENALLSALSDDNYWVKKEIINTFVILQYDKVEKEIDINKNVMAALMQLAKDPDPDIRANTIYFLSFLKDEPKVKALFHFGLKDEDRIVRLRSLVPGIHDFPGLAGMLSDSDHEVRVQTVGLLAKDYGEDSRTIDLLIQALSDPHNLVIHEAIHFLGEFKNSKAVKPLLSLYSSDKRFNITAAHAIENIAGKPLDEVLKEYKSEINAETRPSYTVQALDIPKLLGKIENGTQAEKIVAMHNMSFYREPEALNALLGRLDDDDPRVRYTAIESLKYYISPLSEHLDITYKNFIGKLEDPNPFVRRFVVRAIRFFTRVESYRPRVFKLMSEIINNNHDPLTVREAFSAGFPEPAATEFYLGLRHHEISFIRYQALHHIRMECRPETIHAMLEALNDPVISIRHLAVTKLASVGFVDEEHYRKITNTLEKISKNDRFEVIRNSAKDSLKQLKFERPLIKKQLSRKCDKKNM